MVLWFAAAAVLIVYLVFNSAAMDYRYVVAGAVAPVLEGAVGGPWLLHTFLGSALLLVLVTAVSRGERLRARRLVGLPIGTFLHLVLDGTWSSKELFWWPFAGASLGRGSIPEFEHLGRSIVLELIGIVLAASVVRRFELASRERWRAFVRTGRLRDDRVG